MSSNLVGLIRYLPVATLLYIGLFTGIGFASKYLVFMGDYSSVVGALLGLILAICGFFVSFYFFVCRKHTLQHVDYFDILSSERSFDPESRTLSKEGLMREYFYYIFLSALDISLILAAIRINPFMHGDDRHLTYPIYGNIIFSIFMAFSAFKLSNKKIEDLPTQAVLPFPYAIFKYGFYVLAAITAFSISVKFLIDRTSHY